MLRRVTVGGIESADWRLRQAALLYLSLPNATLCRVASEPGLQAPIADLAAAVVSALSDENDAVSSSASQCLPRLCEAAGESWPAVLSALPTSARKAYSAWAAAGGSGGAWPADEDQPAGSPGQAPAIEQTADSDDSDNEAGPSVSFGFIPAPLMAGLEQSGSWQSRAAAIGQLQELLDGLGEKEGGDGRRAAASHAPALVSFLLRVLDEEQNFKIVLTTLQILSDVLEAFGEAVRAWPEAATVLVPALMDQFADNKIVIRRANLSVVRKLISLLTPARVLRPLLPFVRHPNSHIREQAIAVLLETLGEDEAQPFELHRSALSAVAPALEDPKPKVQRAASSAVGVLGDRIKESNEGGDEVFESLLEELALPPALEARVHERLREGGAAVGFADNLAEVTTPGGTPPMVRSGSAGWRAAAGPEMDDSPFADLMETTAGSRRIATCGRGRLPWEATSDGHKLPRANSLGLSVLAEGMDEGRPGQRASTSHAEERPGGGFGSRRGGGMRIELPSDAASDSLTGLGPLSAPSAFNDARASPTPISPAESESWGPPSPMHSPTKADALLVAMERDMASRRSGGSTSPVPSGDSPVGSPASSSPLGARSGRDKVGMWLPAARVAGKAPGATRPPRPGGDVGGEPSAPAADALQLLKRRQAPLGLNLDASARAPSSAAPMRSPQVRFPFQAVQRSHSAPQKRTTKELAISGVNDAVGVSERLEGAIGGRRGSGAGDAIPCESPPRRLPLRRVGSRLSCLAASSTEAAAVPDRGAAAPGDGEVLPPRGRRSGGGGDSQPALDVVGRASGQQPEAGGGGSSCDSGTLPGGTVHRVGFSPASPRRSLPSEDSSRGQHAGERGSRRGGWGSAAPAAVSTIPLTADGLVGGGISELRTEDLRALPPPPAAEAAVARTLELLKDGDREGDWAAQYEAINMFRRLVAAQDVGSPDPSLLSQLHALNRLLIQFCDSLRSALAKNAASAFREMFGSLGRHMEADLDLIVPMLIKKSAETSGFIADEANKALAAMAASVSEGRVISALSGCATHRNPTARARAALHLSRALEGMGWGRVLHMRELDRIVQVYAALNSEGLSETRSATKHGLVSILREARRAGGETRERLERLLARWLSGPALRKIMDAAETSPPAGALGAALDGIGPPDAARRSQLRASRASRSSSDRRSSHGLSDAPAEAVDERAGALLAALASSNWASRRDGLTALAALSRASPEALVRSPKLLPLLDGLTPQLTYANPKVNLVAIGALEELLPLLGDALVPTAPALVQALGSCLASSNAQVRCAASPCLDALFATVEPGALLGPVAAAALYGSNPRARGAMLERLGELSVSLHPTRPGLVVKHAVGAGLKLLEEARPELRNATISLLRTLHSLLGISLFDAAQVSAACSPRPTPCASR